MRYEEIIRKFIKSYKSKRELKNELVVLKINKRDLEEELETYKDEYKTNRIKTITTTPEIIPITCAHAINRHDINYLNEQERNIQYEKIEYELKRTMFDYIFDSNLIKIHRQLNPYENTEEFIAFLKVVR